MHARELLARFSTFCRKLCNTPPLRKLFVCLSPFFLSDNPGCININNTVMLNSGREVGVFSWISMRSGFVRVAVNKRRRRSNRIIRRILTRKPFLWCRVCSVFLVFFLSLFLSFFYLGFMTVLYIVTVSSSNSNFPRLARKFVQAFLQVKC